MPDLRAVTLSGRPTSLPAAAVSALREQHRGPVLTADDASYDAVRRVWNSMFDRRPALIARCQDTGDVVRAVQFARDHDLLVAVRGGGHSFPGHSVCQDGLLIDLSRQKEVAVDPVQRRARAGAGLLWGDLDRATQAYGLAVTGGQVSHTGIAGLTLGGGLGWLMRSCGLTCDNLRSATVVTADAQVLTASPEENADLFWALRGGGGNFGVVTTFEYALHPVGPIVLGGLIAYPFPAAGPVLRAAREYLATAPDELMITAAFLTTPDGHPALGLALCYNGDPAAGARVTAPLRRFGPVAREQIGPLPYTAVQTMLDDAAPHGRRYYGKAGLLASLTDPAIEIMAEHFAQVPSPQSLVLLVQMGGAVARVQPTATAFVHRQAAFAFTILSIWEDPAEDTANIAWARRFWEDLQPFTNRGVYVNELGDEGEERVHAAYGPAYPRLAALKGRYDPTNVFRLNQNIRPVD